MGPRDRSSSRASPTRSSTAMRTRPSRSSASSSSISHMGFLVLGILAGTDNGYSSALFYVIAYVLMTLASFGMILLLSRAGFEAEELDDFKGLNKKSKWYAFLMMLVMFSLAGL